MKLIQVGDPCFIPQTNGEVVGKVQSIEGKMARVTWLAHESVGPSRYEQVTRDKVIELAKLTRITPGSELPAIK